MRDHEVVEIQQLLGFDEVGDAAEVVDAAGVEAGARALGGAAGD